MIAQLRSYLLVINFGVVFTHMLNLFLRFYTRRRLVVLLAIVLIFFGWRFWRGRQPKFELELAIVVKEDLIESVSASGEVDALELSNLTFQSGGKLAWVGVGIGEEVTKGQALARLDTLLLSRDLQRARADYRSAQATAERALDDVKGNDDDETFQEKEDRTIAEVARDKAFDAVAKAERSLANSTLTAPFDGIVANIQGGRNAGDSVIATTTIYTVVNPKSVMFTADVSEIDIAQINIGQVVLIFLDAYPDETIEGRVKSTSYVSTVSSTGGTAYEVFVDLPEFDLTRFRVGLGGDAEFVTDTKKGVLTVVSTAVVENDESYVWIIEKGKAKKKIVEIGSSSIDNTEVTSGLSEGDEVLERPPSKLEEGDRIKIK